MAYLPTLAALHLLRINTTIRSACDAAELPYTLGERRLKVPGWDAGKGEAIRR